MMPLAMCVFLSISCAAYIYVYSCFIAGPTGQDCGGECIHHFHPGQMDLTSMGSLLGSRYVFHRLFKLRADFPRNPGWHLETFLYKERMERLYFSMGLEQASTCQENRRYALDYLESSPLDCVKRISRSANYVGEVSDDLAELVRLRMEQEEARLVTRLEAVRYEVDAAESLRLLCGPGRVEKVWQFRSSMRASPAHWDTHSSVSDATAISRCSAPLPNHATRTKGYLKRPRIRRRQYHTG